MYVYSAYNLCIHSEWPLPALTEAVGDADIVIRRDAICPEHPQAAHDAGHYIIGKVGAALRFIAEGGTTITIDPDPDLDPAFLQTFISGGLLAIVLRQRGYLVLHASCVSDGENVIGFLGDSGWGKSTTAEYFLQHGYRLLNDDVMAIDARDADALALPGHPYVKLRPEAGEWLLDGKGRRGAGSERLEMGRRVVKRDFFNDSRPLTKLYILDDGDAPDNRLAPLVGHAALLALIRHTRVTNVVNHPAFLAEHLEQCTRLIKTVPISRLERRRALAALPDVFALVEADLARLKLQTSVDRLPHVHNVSA